MFELTMHILIVAFIVYMVRWNARHPAQPYRCATEVVPMVPVEYVGGELL
jgi:hypothetical protein